MKRQNKEFEEFFSEYSDFYQNDYDAAMADFYTDEEYGFFGRIGGAMARGISNGARVAGRGMMQAGRFTANAAGSAARATGRGIANMGSATLRHGKNAAYGAALGAAYGSFSGKGMIKGAIGGAGMGVAVGSLAPKIQASWKKDKFGFGTNTGREFTPSTVNSNSTPFKAGHKETIGGVTTTVAKDGMSGKMRGNGFNTTLNTTQNAVPTVYGERALATNAGLTSTKSGFDGKGQGGVVRFRHDGSMVSGNQKAVQDYKGNYQITTKGVGSSNDAYKNAKGNYIQEAKAANPNLTSTQAAMQFEAKYGKRDSGNNAWQTVPNQQQYAPGIQAFSYYDYDEEQDFSLYIEPSDIERNYFDDKYGHLFMTQDEQDFYFDKYKEYIDLYEDMINSQEDDLYSEGLYIEDSVYLNNLQNMNDSFEDFLNESFDSNRKYIV